MITFKALRDGEYFEIPDYASISAGLEFSDVGGFRIKYAANGVNANKVYEDTIIVAYSNGEELTNGRWRLLGGEDVAIKEGAAYVTISGKSLFDIFNRTLVIQPGTETKTAITDQTPGKVLIDMFNEAQARGAMAGFTWDFTAQVDSNGNPWNQNIWVELERGKDYYTYIQQWIEQGKFELDFQGMEIRVFNEGTNGRDLSESIELLGGRHYTETPIKRSIEDRAQRVLSLGDNDTYAVASAGVAGPFGYEETSVQQGGTDDDGVLSLLAQNTLQMMNASQQQHTRKVDLRTLGWDPGADFKVGDWISERVTGSRSKYRVRAITLTIDQNDRSASLVLNDKINERDIKLKRKMAGISGSGNGSVNSPVTPTPDKDTTVPRPPTNPVLSTEVYTDANGDTRGVAEMQWAAPETNTDGTPITDLSHYDVWWKNVRVESTEMPTEMGKMGPYPPLNSLLDRRTDGFGWVGGDGAASVRKPDGLDIWIFGDSVIGKLNATNRMEGGAGSDWWMVNNSLVETDPDDASHFRTLVGQTNLLPEGMAATLDSTWQAARVAWGYVPEPESFSGYALELIPEGGGSSYVRQDLAFAETAGSKMAVSGGVVTVLFKSRTADGSSTNASLAFRGYGPAGEDLGWVGLDTFPIPSGETLSHVRTVVVPAGAAWLTPMLICSPNVGQQVRFFDLAVYHGDQRHQPWTLDQGTGPRALVRPEAAGWKSIEYTNYLRGFRETVQSGGTSIAVMGDEITADPTLYRDGLQTLLRDEFGNANITLNTPAEAVSTIQDVLTGPNNVAYWASVVASAPEHGVALFGKNDYSVRTAAEFAQDVVDLVARWEAEVPGKGLTIALYPETLDPPATWPFSEYATQVRATLAGTDVDLVDMNRYVLDVRNNLATNPAMRTVSPGGGMVDGYLHNGGFTVGTPATEADGTPFMSVDLAEGQTSVGWGVRTQAVPARMAGRVAHAWEVRAKSGIAEVRPATYSYSPSGNKFIWDRTPHVVGTEWTWVYADGSSAFDADTQPVPYLYSGYGAGGENSREEGVEVRRVVVDYVSDPGERINGADYFDGSTVKEGMVAAWVGVSDYSESRMAQDYTPALVSSLIFDRLQNPLSDYYWFGDGWTANGKLYVQGQIIGPHWPTPDGWNFAYKKRTDLLIWDATTMEFEAALPWIEGDITWTNSVYVEGTFVYVFGQYPNGDACLMRAPLADPTTGLQAWDGSVWTSDLSSPAVVLAGYAVTSLRKIGNEYHAYHSDGFGDKILQSKSTAITGPYTGKESIYEIPDVGGGTYAYIPRAHPQFDSPQGLVMGYSRNTTNDWMQNVTNGVPRFAIGAPSQPQAVSLDSIAWSNAEQTTDTRAFASSLLPGTAFTYQVRAVDSADPVHRSEWIQGPVAVVAVDRTPPNAPSKPLVQPVFQGLRAVWDGLDYLGALPPKDWERIEFHINTFDNFTPSAETLLDSMPLISGGAFAVQGLKAVTEYFVRFVAVDRNGNRSDPSETASTITTQLVNIDLPDRLVTGAKLAKESVNAAHLTVGSLSDNMMRNGNMEEWDEERNLPFGMEESWWGDNAITPSKNTTTPISGTQSLRVTIPAVGGATGLRSWRMPIMPIAARGVYSVTMRIRTDRALTDSEFYAAVQWGATESEVSGYHGTADIAATRPTDEAVGTEWLYTGSVGVGDNARFGAVVLHFNRMNETTTDVNIDIDEISMQRVVGGADIGYAAIYNAHISYLDLNEGNVSKLNVGNLMSGVSTADISIAGRFKTLPLAGSAKRVEFGADGIFQYNDADEQVTRLDSNSGGIVCRWFRTEASGARIEMGTYGMGSDTALISFFPDASNWQFPPALGFGGENRRGQTPGLAMHAGSLSETYYNRYGMNMISVDQASGINLVTGNLLDGTQASEGADININAGGDMGIVRLTGGGVGGAQDRAELILSPRRLNDNRTNIPFSKLDLWYGTLNFAPSPYGNYNIRFAASTEWGAWPKNHILHTAHSYRFETTNNSNAFTIDTNGDIKPNGVVRGTGWNEAAMIKTQGTDAHRATIFYDGTNIGIVVYNSSGTQVAAKNL